MAAALEPATLLGFHRALKARKDRRLFSPQRRGKPGPKGPSKELIQAIVPTESARNRTLGLERRLTGEEQTNWRGVANFGL